MINSYGYAEFDPQKKDKEWANKLITRFRTNWKPLVSEKRSKEGQDMLFSKNDTDFLKKMFTDPDRIGFKITGIAIMEKVRNILNAERNKAGVHINLKANDTSSKRERDADYELLKNRPEIEKTISALQETIGLNPYKLSSEKKLNGKNPFRGNIDQFDEMRLNANDGEKIDWFFKSYYNLRHEIAGQSVVNHYFSVNEVEKFIEQWCNDVHYAKAIAIRTYVNELSGCIDQRYIHPGSVRNIPGKRSDGKDAKCIGYEMSMSVNEFLRLVGNEFDFERDMPELLHSVNLFNGTSLSGIYGQAGDLGGMYWGDKSKSACSYAEFFDYEVGVGYIEWRSTDAKAYKTGKTSSGHFRRLPMDVNIELSKGTKYEKEVWYYESIYKSYFLVTGNSAQRLYKYGRLFYQSVEGATDEYSNYSICIEQMAGPTLCEIAAPFIEMAQEAFTKLRWFLRRAKPNGRQYNYSAIVKLANRLIGSGNDFNDVNEFIKKMEEGINEIFMVPEMNGNPLGGAPTGSAEKKNGIDPTAMTFTQIIDYAVKQIMDKIGVNEMLTGSYSPSPNDGYKLHMQALAMSRNATEYIGTMIMRMLSNSAEYVLKTSQDIVRYKRTIAYEYMRKALGEDAIVDLQEMNGFAFHRYGVFINSVNDDLDRQEMKVATAAAFQSGEIGFEVMLMINGIRDPKKAGMILSFEKWLSKKEALEAEQRKMVTEDQINENKHNRDIELESLKIKGDIAGKNVEGQWYYKAHKANADARIITQEMREENEPKKVATRTEAEIKKEQAKSNIREQES